MRQRKPRQQNKKQDKKYVVIFCEGDTEICYFKVVLDFFGKSCPYQILLIDKAKGKINTGKEELVAIGKSRNRQLKDKLSDKLKSSITNADMKQVIHSVYFLTDIDDESKNNCFNKDQIDRIRKVLSESGIKVLFSNRDIETFIYAHIDYSPSDSCDYQLEIKKKYPKYDKGNSLSSQQTHEEIIGGKSGSGIKNLRNNMAKLKEYHESNGNTHISDMNPYSEVVELIDEFLPDL